MRSGKARHRRVPRLKTKAMVAHRRVPRQWLKAWVMMLLLQERVMMLVQAWVMLLLLQG